MNSIRVSVPNWQDEKAFAELCSLLSDYRDCVEQVAFFSSDFHPPLPLSVARERSSLLRERVRRVKALGFSGGINVLSTIGHHPERMDEALHGDWQHMTNIDGEENEAVFCPGDERYREEYVAPLYRLFSEAEPDFIWVDDDVRYDHLPTGRGCYCRGCVDRFNRAYGYSFDRASLKKALTSPDGAELRKKWLRKQSETIAELLRFVARTVRASSDGIRLGFMSGERYAGGYGFDLWADALSEGGAYEIMWRPGGGAYSDRPFAAFTEKARQIGRQTARLPSCVTSVQSEIECFPYRILEKSPRSTALETLLYVGAGATGAALNILPNAPGGESLSIMRGHFDALRRTLPFEKKLSRVLGRSPSCGVFDGWHPLANAALSDSFPDGSGGSFPEKWNELFSLGIPRAFDFGKAKVYLLTGSMPLAYSGEELLHILSSGVYMDAEALDVLNGMGYRSLTGFDAGDPIPEDSVERYADHPLHESFAGGVRLCPQIFIHGVSRSLLPDPGAEILCGLFDHRGRKKADCSMGLFRNALGGTVCVSSHYPLCGFSDSMKSLEMKRLFRLLSGDTLPFLSDSLVRISLIARETETGPAAVLLNPNFDRLEGAAILAFGGKSAARFTNERGEESLLPAAGTDGAMTRFLLPPLEPYETALLEPLS
ncbi:MAG: hypothetical protein J5849_07025 [Clostridia bacterium]|nr:hypothetical protein [Clostridia bacterium]